jgi:hypothetical protein
MGIKIVFVIDQWNLFHFDHMIISIKEKNNKIYKTYCLIVYYLTSIYGGYY